MDKKMYAVLRIEIHCFCNEVLTQSKEVDFDIDDWFGSDGGWI